MMTSKGRLTRALALGLVFSLHGCGWVDASGTESGADSGGASGPEASPFSLLEGGELVVQAEDGVLADHADPQATAILIEPPQYAREFDLQPDGAFRYLHDGSEESEDRFTYRVRSERGDSDRQSVRLEVQPVNDRPAAEPLHLETAAGQAVTGRIRVTDPDHARNQLSFRPKENPSWGTVKLESDGGFTYTPPGDYTGSDQFSIRVIDPEGAGDTALVSIDVLPVIGDDGGGGSRNRPPQVSDLSLRTLEDTTVTGRLNASDPDGDPLSYTVSAPEHGIASVNRNGVVEYAPAPNHAGSDRFTVTVTDAAGAKATASVQVTIEAVNDPPVAIDARFSVDAGGGLESAFRGSDPDDDPLQYTIVQQPVIGSVRLLDAATGRFSYTTPAGARGTDTIRFTVSDGRLTSGPGTVTIEIVPQTTPPVARPDSAQVTEDGISVATGNLLDNDSDPDGGGLTLTAVSGTTQPRVTGAYGDLSWSEGGDFRYELDNQSATTDALAEGEQVLELFRYTIINDQGSSAEGELRVTVVGRNDPPQVQADSYRLNGNSDLRVEAADGVLANDSDVDSGLTARLEGEPPTGLQFEADGSFTYTSDGGEGDVEFHYRANDGFVDSDPVRVVLARNSNLALLASDACWETSRDQPVVQTLSTTVVEDAESPLLTFSTVEAPTKGRLHWLDTEQGRFEYEPDPQEPGGRDRFVYQVTDAEGASATGEVSIVVAMRIMPLGDGLTDGVQGNGEPGPLERVGYRNGIHQALSQDAYPFDLVGGQLSGQSLLEDAEHEGHSGAGLDEVAAHVYQWLEANPADIVLLQIGSEAPALDVVDVGRILDEIDRWEQATGTPVTVLLARIIDRYPPDPNGQITTYNDAVARLVAERAGDEIQIVDMQSAFWLDPAQAETAGYDWPWPDPALYADTRFPNPDGYARMAATWYPQLIGNLHKCP